MKKLSLNITEQEYRDIEAISYSSLSRFKNECLEYMINKEQLDTPALRFGSVVDCLMTNEDKFKDLYYVNYYAENIYQKEKEIINYIYINYKIKSLDDLDDSDILRICDEFEYRKSYKDETRINRIRSFSTYYTSLIESEGKIIISYQDYEDAKKCIDALNSNDYIHSLINSIQDPFDCKKYIKEVKKQEKFVVDKLLNFNTKFKCMCDYIIYNEDGSVDILDLKTTGKDERLFVSSFLKYNYAIQCWLYTRILEELGYKVNSFKFIVINRETLTPLVYETTADEVENINEFSRENIINLISNYIVLSDDEMFKTNTINLQSLISFCGLNK